MGLWQDKTRKDWCYSFQYRLEIYASRGYKTKKDAVAARAERKKDVKNKPIETGMVFSEAINLYLDHAKRSFAPKTYQTKVYVYKCFYTFLKTDFNMRDITTQVIDAYLKTRPTNHNYNAHKKEISALFTYSKDILEIIDKNPVKKLKDLPHTKKIKTMPSEEDIIKLLLAANPHNDEKNLIIVLLHTVARIDEILRLTWQDINFEKRTLIKRTKKTKSRGYKEVPVKINDDLYKTLWRMWENRKQERWVFYRAETDDRYYRKANLMKALCKRAGITPHFGFHTLRHLMASLLNDNPKVTIGTIQNILGHETQKTTEIYLHRGDAAIESAMDSLAGKFAEKNENRNPTRNQKGKKSGE